MSQPRSLRAAPAWIICAAFCAHAQQAPPAYPPLGVEISAEHPLFLFDVHPAGDAAAVDAYGIQILAAWAALPEDIRPYAILQLDPGGNAAARRERAAALMPALQDAGVPVTLRVADRTPAHRIPSADIEALFQAHTAIKGVEVMGLDFNYYPGPRAADAPLPDPLPWLIAVIDAAARYGRFVYLPLDGLNAVRLMANTWCAPLYEKIKACSGHVLPAVLHRGIHTLPQTAALLGLWLEGAAANWGVAADAEWYRDAGFVEPGRFGIAPGGPGMPPALYRAMILNGAMTGAAVYAFASGAHLWHGAAPQVWDNVIHPMLNTIRAKGLIARKDFVLQKTKVAFRLAPAASPQDMRLNSRDIDPEYDTGFLIQAACGVDLPGKMPELIPNRGENFWVPIVSMHSDTAALSPFAAVVQAGTQPGVEAWAALLDPYRQSAGEGPAFIAQVGRGLFIMNTKENLREPQAFSIPEAPAPVRAFSARREDGGIVIAWPFREGDVSFNVYRRVPPEAGFTPLVEGYDQRRFLDEAPPQDLPAAYSVTALTNEKEPFSGTVGYGECLALSVVESRIAEEVVLPPALEYAESRALLDPVAPPASDPPWWPAMDGVPDEYRADAEAIAARIEAWDRAFSAADLDGVLDLYAREYEDPQGWRTQYVRRAYQWFFERYRAPRMHRQIRQWDFSAAPDQGRVNLLAYCRLTGVAISDPAGRTADQPISIPRTESAEVWMTWISEDGAWRLLSTNPALPSFSDLLSYSTGPYDHFPLGPDRTPAP